ncbi:winged helix DNA-binding protein [Terrarubrum flagellatum]|uniref:winged helix DNA-binding protein n=1 Tax=Terrirubrum flagellatum TaxID=2895980 RepID=UPI0031452ACA
MADKTLAQAQSTAGAPDIPPVEGAINAFEYAAWHFGSAFARWRRDCLSVMPGIDLGGTEASILHVLHLNGTAKGLSDIARLLHRDDLANLQYGLKKLLSLGYIEKAGEGASRRHATYATSKTGAAIVDAYMLRRRESLIRLAATMSGTEGALQQATAILHVMTGLYDQASTIVTSPVGDQTGFLS